MKRTIVKLGLFSVSVIIAVFFLINYSHNDDAVPQKVVKTISCPEYFYADKLENGTKTCKQYYYIVDTFKPSNEFTKTITSIISGTIKSMIVSSTTTLYLDSGSYQIENTTVDLYVGKIIKIDQELKSPKECNPDRILYISNSTGNVIITSGNKSQEIIENKHYHEFMDDADTYLKEKYCPNHTVYEVEK